MANVWAIKSGDWSDTTVWNTGALPTYADDVYANNFNVNVNQSVTVNSLNNTAPAGIPSAGGYFNISTAITMNVNALNFTNSTSANNLLLISANTGDITIDVNATISLSGSSVGNKCIIQHTGNCNLTISATNISNNYFNGGATTNVIQKSSIGLLTINSNVTVSGNNSGNSINITGNGKTVINGHISAGSGNLNTIYAASGELTVNGNVNGGTGSGAALNNLSKCTIIGNIQGNTATAIISSGELYITGTISGSNANGVPSIEISSGILNHIGTIQASAFSSGLRCNNPLNSTVICTGPFLKNGYIVAIASQTLRINFNSNSYFQFKKSNGDDIDYVSTVEGYNYPLASDVRYGVEYKSGLAIGTCHVPTPDNVRKNIPVDNTVGTSDNVNAEDILQAIQDSTLPIAQRLRNVATVESTGAQITSFN